jgi:pimeloyl-ACP methyl ester carboxylesterase
LVTAEGVVHYEMDGRGAPVVLLHGWLNSWDVWRTTMLSLSDTKRYRIYALDFWGWGESDKRTAQFTLSSYASMVVHFMEAMGIQRAPVVGHSMGGTVALTVALDFPEKVDKVAVVGSPIVGSSLNLMLQLAGQKNIARLLWRIPFVLDLIIWWVLAREGKDTYAMIRRDVSRTTMEAFFRSINDLRKTDLRPRLPEIRMSALGVFGKRDNIVNPNQARLMAQAIPQARVEVMPNARHFPMRDEPERFLKIVSEFLAN